ncbi:hypothetical protein FRC10_001803 [Ceratobasidium sp. 414]|nr:hypothetical protein FRC10_001803 [Ceratobasidium sp. 414]
MFGELRKLVKDFAYRDVLFALPKLRVILHASYQASVTIKQSTSTNSQPKKAADEQVVIRGTYRVEYAPSTQNPIVPTQGPEPEASQEWVVEDTKEVTALEALQANFSVTESSALPSYAVSKQRDNVIYATSALEVERFNVIDQLPSDAAKDIHAEGALIQKLLTCQQPQLYIPDIDESLLEHNCTPSVELNPKALVAFRQAHQTEQAYKSPKNFRQGPADKSGNPSHKAHSDCQYIQLARTYEMTLRNEGRAKLPERITC